MRTDRWVIGLLIFFLILLGGLIYYTQFSQLENSQKPSNGQGVSDFSAIPQPNPSNASREIDGVPVTTYKGIDFDLELPADDKFEIKTKYYPLKYEYSGRTVTKTNEEITFTGKQDSSINFGIYVTSLVDDEWGKGLIQEISQQTTEVNGYKYKITAGDYYILSPDQKRYALITNNPQLGSHPKVQKEINILFTTLRFKTE